jgi:hypothetical protein
VTRRVFVYDPELSGWLAVLLLVGLVALGCLLGCGAAGVVVGAVVFAVLAAVALCGAWLLFRRGRQPRWFFRYPGGLIEVRADEPGPRVLRLADMDAVTLVFNDAENSWNGLSTCTLSTGEMSITPPYDRPATRDLAGDAERILGPRIVPALISAYESGEPVVFGSWRISQAGVSGGLGTTNTVFVPWADVHDITVASEKYSHVDPPSLVVLTFADGPESRTKSLRLSLSGVRNGVFLPVLLRHIAERGNLPLSDVVVAPGKGGT